MYNIAEITNTISSGHALAELQKFPSDSIDCIITSSPYFGLRTYDTEPQIWGGDKNCNHVWNSFEHKGISGGTKSVKVQIKDKDNFQIVPNTQQSVCLSCGAWLGELGQEPTPQMFIVHLVEIFMECTRVLKPEGTMWINISDSYSGSNQGAGAGDKTGTKQLTNKGTNYTKEKGYKSLLAKLDIPKKSLIGIPDRLKIALIDKGLICRNQIIWKKPNKMPESCKDRFTNDYEMFFFFTKNTKYYFEQQLEPYKSKENHNPRDKASEKYEGTGLFSKGGRDYYSQGNRNVRTVWDINTIPSKIPHFAMFPEELVKRPILAGCPEFVCENCGKGREKILISKRLKRSELSKNDFRYRPNDYSGSYGKINGKSDAGYCETKDTGELTDCGCSVEFGKGIVLDPFIGSGTTARVAKKLGRNYIGIELNPEYAEEARKSLENIT